MNINPNQGNNNLNLGNDIPIEQNNQNSENNNRIEQNNPNQRVRNAKRRRFIQRPIQRNENLDNNEINFRGNQIPNVPLTRRSCLPGLPILRALGLFSALTLVASIVLDKMYPCKNTPVGYKCPQGLVEVTPAIMLMSVFSFIIASCLSCCCACFKR